MMSLGDRFEVRPVIGLEQKAVDRAADRARSLGFTGAQVDDICTAVREACLNAAEHGTTVNDTYEVTIWYDSTTLSVEVWSWRVAIHPGAAPPHLETKIDGNENPRGWGIFLMQRLADSCTFETRNGGTVVRLTFQQHRSS